MTANRIFYLYALFFSFVFFVLMDQYLFHLIIHKNTPLYDKCLLNNR